MKKRILTLVLAALLSFTLSGCTGFTLNVSELMHPPKATGENAEIQKLIDNHAGENYTLKYPQSGAYRTAVTTTDYDGDGDEEAVAFYLPAGEAQTIHLLIMKEVKGEWTVVGDHVSNSTRVDRLIFADLDGDKVKEIIVGWSSYNSLINSISLYLTEKGKSTEIPSNFTYTDILVGDFTAKGREELMLLSLYTPERPATASLVTLNDTRNNIYAISETPIDDDVVSFSQLLCGNVFDGQFGVAVDGITSSGTYCTQLLYFSEYFASLQRVSFTDDTPVNQATRSYAIKCCDIDSDGIIEVPNTFRMNLDQTQVDVVPAALIYWCEYTSLGQMVVDRKDAASLVYGFYFSIPERWGDDITAYANFSTNEITFCQWDDKNGFGDQLLVIKMFTPEAWEDEVSSRGYTEITRNDSYIYTFSVPQSNSSLLLTNDEVIEAFSLM